MIDKMRLLIQRLPRHQFGRRCEQLTPDQLQLVLEEVEQISAANQAGQDAVMAAAGLCANYAPRRWRTSKTAPARAAAMS